VKVTVKKCHIPAEQLEILAADRTKWRSMG